MRMAKAPRRTSRKAVETAADRAEARSKGEEPKSPAEPSPLGPPETTKRDVTTGRFLPGNRFWEARSSAGPKPKFAQADDLWDACVEYFEWVDAHPLWEDRLVTFQGAASHEPAAKMRAMTLQGLCLFLDVSIQQWRQWRKERADLLSVLTRAEAVIYAQKFAGAAADLLNANIIARDLGLAEKSEHSGPDGGPIEMTALDSSIDQARRVAFALGKALERQRAKANASKADATG